MTEINSDERAGFPLAALALRTAPLAAQARSECLVVLACDCAGMDVAEFVADEK
jgi:hypothetical protein